MSIVYSIPHSIPISAHHGWNLDDLLEKMWEYLDLARVYTMPKGQLPDYSAPVVIKKSDASVEKFYNTIHKRPSHQQTAEHCRSSTSRRKSEYVLCDEDVIQIIKKT
ncbi:hypothetical protein HDU98_003470 [Podochytrium sp. JEL0797]|nr:hypothetical protein HDU98_003470 [Podochytrium sp. JEL0797]